MKKKMAEEKVKRNFRVFKEKNKQEEAVEKDNHSSVSPQFIMIYPERSQSVNSEKPKEIKLK